MSWRPTAPGRMAPAVAPARWSSVPPRRGRRTRRRTRGERHGAARGDSTSPWRRVAPWPCRTSPVRSGAPCPAPPTVRAVCPRPAVRPASSPTRRRWRRVRAPAAAQGDASQRLPLAVRQPCPSATPALPAWGQGPATPARHATLQPPPRWAGVRLSARGRPPGTERMHPRHACLRAAWCPARREGLQAVPPLRWSRLGGDHVAGVLPAPGTLPRHAVDADALASRGDACPGRLGAGARARQALGAPRAGGAHRLGAAAADQAGRLGVAVAGRATLRRGASTRPPVLEQVQGEVAGHRRERGALGPPTLRVSHRSLAVGPDRARLLAPLPPTAGGAPPRAQRPALAGRAARTGRLAITLPTTPSTGGPGMPQRLGRWLGLPRRAGAVGAVRHIRRQERLQEALQRRRPHALVPRRQAAGAWPALGLGSRDPPHGGAPVLRLAPRLGPCLSPRLCVP